MAQRERAIRLIEFRRTNVRFETRISRSRTDPVTDKNKNQKRLADNPPRLAFFEKR